MNGCRIGVADGSYQKELLDNWLDSNKIQAEVVICKGYDEMIEKLDADELDADELDALVIPALSVNSDFIAIANIGVSDCYFGVSKSRPDLLKELNSALEEINNTETDYSSKLYARYEGKAIINYALNKEEKQCLDTHENTIRVGYLKDNLPFCGEENGKLTGILGTVLDTVQEKYGITIKSVPCSTGAQMNEKLQSDEIDIAMKRNPDKEVENCLKKIRQSSEYLMTLINDVLDISRIESGKLEYKPVPVDLRDMINTVLSIARGYIENRDLNLYISREELKNPYVMADELRIREVLLNIISNAVKFTKDGGTISFYAENCPGNDEHHMNVRYRITDTGIGMSEEFQTRIFDEFSQENNGVRTSYKGTGLGMAIAKQYVDLMGGKIEVSSKQGVGSTFTVEIPLLIAEHVETEEKEKLRKDMDLHGLHVLLTEDNDLNAEIAIALLEEKGVIVTRAADGKSAGPSGRKGNTYYCNDSKCICRGCTGCFESWNGRPCGEAD